MITLKKEILFLGLLSESTLRGRVERVLFRVLSPPCFLLSYAILSSRTLADLLLLLPNLLHCFFIGTPFFCLSFI